MRSLVVICLMLCSGLVGAQAPIINNVTPLNTFPQNKILINGSGFNSTPGNFRVSFDQIQVTPTVSSDFSLEVTVPAQSRLSNVEVINVGTGLSAKSLNKFVPFYSGTNFLTTDMDDPAVGTTSFSTGSNEAFDVCTCDLDGDGKPDVAGTKSTLTANDIILLRNTGTPGVTSFVATNFIVGAPTFNVACGDLNGDGKPDLVASRGGTTRNEVFVLRNTSVVGAISFATPVRLFLDAGEFAFRVVIRDLNLDGKSDVIVSNSLNSATNANSIYIFTNLSTTGAVTFNTSPTKIAVTGAATTYGMDAQDLDGDSKPDIILNQFNAPDIFILQNGSSVGQIAFPTIIKVPLAGNLNHLTTADFNEDGKLDIAVTSSANDNKAFVLLNQTTSGTISFPSAMTLTGGDWPWGIDAADVDGDQDVDIVIGNINNNGVPTNEIVLFKNDGNNTNLTFTRQSIQKGKKSRNLKVGDLDGDGKPDIVYTTVNTNSIDILRNKNCYTPVIVNPPPTICAGQTIRLNAIANAGATFDWKQDGVSVKNGTEPFLDITAPASYTVTAKSEGIVCSLTSPAAVLALGTGTLPANPVLSANTPLCSGQTLNLSVPTVAGATYLWTGPRSFSSSLQNPSKSAITINEAGFYTLKLSDGNCSVESNIKVDVSNLANFFVSSSVASNSVCQGSTINLLVNTVAGHTYQWIKDGVDIVGQTASTMTASVDGLYKVRVTNTSLGCSIEPTGVTVKILTTPVSAFTPSATQICTGKDVTFANSSTSDSRATVAYAWTFGDGTTSTLATPTKNWTTAGPQNVQLTVSYTGVAGCSNASTKSIDVGAPQTPVLSASLNPICAGETTVLSSTGTFATYAWTGPETGSTATLSVTKAGTYVLNTVEANGCTGTGQIVITEKPALTLTVTVDAKPVVDGANVLVFAGIPLKFLATGAEQYSWDPVTGLSDPLIANPVATPLVETTYTVTGSKPASCDAKLSFSIKFDPAGNVFSPPNAFSPNGDAINDLWVIPTAPLFTECTLSIFTSTGSRVFEQKGYTNNWDAVFEGKELPSGTYYYVLNCPDKDPVTGHVLVAR